MDPGIPNYIIKTESFFLCINGTAFLRVGFNSPADSFPLVTSGSRKILFYHISHSR